MNSWWIQNSMSTTCLHSHTSIYSQLIPDVHIVNTEQRLATMSVSLRTKTGWPNLTVQILKTRVHLIDIWYTFLNSVHYNLDHGLTTVTRTQACYDTTDRLSNYRSTISILIHPFIVGMMDYSVGGTAEIIDGNYNVTTSTLTINDDMNWILDGQVNVVDKSVTGTIRPNVIAFSLNYQGTEWTSGKQSVIKSRKDSLSPRRETPNRDP